MLPGGGSVPIVDEFVNVILITGQSNAVGYALTSDLNGADLDAFANVMLWNDDSGVMEFQPLHVGVNESERPYTEGERHGVEIALARKYYNNFTEPLYIVKFGWGGTSILDHLDTDPSLTHWVYPEFWNDNVFPAINNLLSEGKRPRVWMYWHQGEANAQGDTYENYFTQWQTLVRTNLKNNNIPFFATELSATHASKNVIFNNMAEESIRNLTIQKAQDLATIPTDLVHFNTASFEIIADRLIDNLLVTAPIELTKKLYDEVENPFSAIITVDTNDGDRWLAYSGLEIVDNDRIYIFYRDGTGHNPFDGIIFSKYSDDDGETWSSHTVVYDPIVILDDYPQYIIDNPDVKFDARDTRCLISPDGSTMIVTFFVAIGNTNVDGDRVYYEPFKLISIAIPIIGRELDYANKTVVYVDEDNHAFSGSMVNVGNEMWINGYISSVKNTIYKSSDNGSTWNEWKDMWNATNVGGDNNWASSESTLSNVDGVIFGFGRPVYQPTSIRRNIFAKSIDDGISWEYSYDTSPFLLVGQNSVALNDGRIACYGRDEQRPGVSLFVVNTSDYSVENGYLNWSLGRGYGTIKKYKDKYILSWQEAAYGIQFRQMNYNPDTYTFEFGND